MYESNLDEFEHWISNRYPGQPEFLQATREIAKDVMPIYNAHQQYKRYNVFKRLCEPERSIHFTVQWLNDDHEVEIHHGWRIQHCGLIGPYKGGLRFHPTVNESVLKFLAFEQSFKNALTGLPIGGAKGGSDFDPKGRSEAEIMRFCQAFMGELQRHIGPYTDVPAGDINVGSREIGFLYGEYRRINNRFGGSITGKDVEFGGSHVRTEATGYGLVYMLDAVLSEHNERIEGKSIGISGAGNVALHAAAKATELGGRVISLSNSRGCLYKKTGIPRQAILWARDNKQQHSNILKELQQHDGGEWMDNQTPWQFAMDIALPCATQNELDRDAARALLDNQCRFVLEGANMPCTDDARQQFLDAGIAYVPGKASNAGGVALSGMEMAQNASFHPISYAKLDRILKSIMQDIHEKCVQEGRQDGMINYARGANIAAFRRLADAMVSQGI